MGHKYIFLPCIDLLVLNRDNVNTREDHVPFERAGPEADLPVLQADADYDMDYDAFISCRSVL